MEPCMLTGRFPNLAFEHVFVWRQQIKSIQSFRVDNKRNLKNTENYSLHLNRQS